jgi:hypothetical protein
VVGRSVDYLPIGFLAGLGCGLAGLGAAAGFPIGMPFLGSFGLDWFTEAPPLRLGKPSWLTTQRSLSKGNASFKTVYEGEFLAFWVRQW